MGPLLLSMARETVLWPLAATLVVIALSLLLRRHVPIQIPGALALCAGFLTGYALIYGTFSFPPKEAQGWIPYFLALNVALFSYDDLIGFPRKTRLILQASLSILYSLLIFSPLFRTGFSLRLSIASVVLWFALWVMLDGESSFALFFVAIGNAVVSATTGSTMLGQLGGALAAVLGMHLLFNIPKSRIPLGHAGVAVSLAVLASLMLIGRTYAETALVPNLLLLAAVPIDFAARKAFGNRERLVPYIGAAFALIPVAIASYMAVKSYMAQEY